METFIFWASFAFAFYWAWNWWEHRKASIGHSAQIICAAMLWAVVVYFGENREVSRYHMLWAMPAAFFGSTLVSAPYIRWRTKALLDAKVREYERDHPPKE